MTSLAAWWQTGELIIQGWPQFVRDRQKDCKEELDS
jgi:hypothetical protein